jgi:hypothetical protein
MRRKGQERPIGSALGDLVSAMPADVRQRMVEAQAIDLWFEVVPEKIARHTRPLELRDGVLVIQVDSPVWATELTAMSERFRTMLVERLGKRRLKSVRFTVSRKVAAEREVKAQEETIDPLYLPEPFDPVPLTAEERRHLEVAAEAIEDDRLRQAFLKAAIADAELAKGRKQANGPQNG